MTSNIWRAREHDRSDLPTPDFFSVTVWAWRTATAFLPKEQKLVTSQVSAAVSCPVGSVGRKLEK